MHFLIIAAYIVKEIKIMLSSDHSENIKYMRPRKAYALIPFRHLHVSFVNLHHKHFEQMFNDTLAVSDYGV